MANSAELIFVYNASSSIFSQLTDYAHKIISPETYSCNLCKITYDNLGMKSKWKTFIKSLNLNVTFLHKDELKSRYPEFSKSKLPMAFLKQNNKVSQLISAKEINSVKTLDGLMELADAKLKHI